MKILFFIFHGFSPYSGVSRKIIGQVDGLRKNGHDVDICHYDILPDGHHCRMINDDVLEDFGTGLKASIKRRIYYGAVVDYILTHNVELIYIRSFNNADPFIIHFLKKLKQHGIKAIMEVPTYPYDHEYKGYSFAEKAGLEIDKIFRRSQARQLLRIVTFSEADNIFGIKTIKISNGIDFKSIHIKDKIRKTPSPFNLIGVAEVHYWHGFDRIISGMGEYYKRNMGREVYFHIVGGVGASEQSLFDDIISRYSIKKYIIFHGELFGEKLDELFEKADFAVASLGRHRTGIDKIKTLKNREYAARGIPFVYSETDSDFDDKNYIMKAPADDSPIPIKCILDFYDSHSFDPGEIRESVTHLDWKIQMGRVIDYIKENQI